EVGSVPGHRPDLAARVAHAAHQPDSARDRDQARRRLERRHAAVVCRQADAASGVTAQAEWRATRDDDRRLSAARDAGGAVDVVRIPGAAACWGPTGLAGAAGGRAVGLADEDRARAAHPRDDGGVLVRDVAPEHAE